MKINKSIEQGVFVIIMLELEKDHRPLKCPILSKNLGVSTSYLQKILHRLVEAGLVNSTASKDGGYTIAKKAKDITIADIMDAVDEVKMDFDSARLAENLFGNDSHVGKAERLVEGAFKSGINAMRDALSKISIEDLLEKDRNRNGSIEWERCQRDGSNVI